jgi:hypothetical protein
MPKKGTQIINFKIELINKGRVCKKIKKNNLVKSEKNGIKI